MEYSGLREARLLRRYKRFLADVEFDDGEVITVHCPNTGAMTGCANPGSRVWISDSNNPRRKYRYTWELVETASGLARINSAGANRLVLEALEAGGIESLCAYERWRSEVKYGDENSRIDLLLEGDGKAPCYIEVKSVTLVREPGLGEFPDAVSQRGLKHLRELGAMREQGARAVLLFCVQHTHVDAVEVAADIDPAYSEGLQAALAKGVEVLCCSTEISPLGVRINGTVPFRPGFD